MTEIEALREEVAALREEVASLRRGLYGAPTPTPGPFLWVNPAPHAAPPVEPRPMYPGGPIPAWSGVCVNEVTGGTDFSKTYGPNAP